MLKNTGELKLIQGEKSVTIILFEAFEFSIALKVIYIIQILLSKLTCLLDLSLGLFFLHIKVLLTIVLVVHFHIYYNTC